MTLLTYNQRTFSVLNLNSTGSRTVPLAAICATREHGTRANIDVSYPTTL